MKDHDCYLHTQRNWLNLLQSISPDEIKLTPNRPDGKTPTYPISLKSWKFGLWGNADFRTILPNEILLDLDVSKIATVEGKKEEEITWSRIKEVYLMLMNRMALLRKVEKEGNQNTVFYIPYYLWNTAGKSIHISIFLNANMVDKVVGWKSIRRKIADKLLGELNPYFDQTKINFSNYSLVRCEGGERYHKIIRKTIEDWGKTSVKTVKTLLTEIPNERPDPTEAIFPRKIKKFDIPSSWLKNFTDLIIIPDCKYCGITPPEQNWVGCKICRGEWIDGDFVYETVPISNGNKNGKVRPCIKNIINDRKHGWIADTMVGNELVNIGAPDNVIHECFQLMEPNYHPDKTQRQVEFIRRKGYFKWSCSKIMDIGYCLHEQCPIYEKVMKNGSKRVCDNGRNDTRGEASIRYDTGQGNTNIQRQGNGEVICQKAKEERLGNQRGNQEISRC